jgi:hypothetical protein
MRPIAAAATHREVQEDLATKLQWPSDDVGVEITHQQRELEEQEADAPGRRAAAEPGQDVLSKHRLNEKDQEPAERDRERIGRLQECRDHRLKSNACAGVCGVRTLKFYSTAKSSMLPAG